MIGELKYEDLEKITADLKRQVDTLNRLLKARNTTELNDFIATLEAYTKYLESTIEMNKDADKALADLIKNKS